MLIASADLIEFLAGREKPKQSCRLHESYCFKCKAPREAGLGEAEIVSVSATSVNLRMLCATCATLMHKRVSKAQPAALSTTLRISAPQAFKHLIETKHPCLNVHYEEAA